MRHKFLIYFHLYLLAFIAVQKSMVKETETVQPGNNISNYNVLAVDLIHCGMFKKGRFYNFSSRLKKFTFFTVQLETIEIKIWKESIKKYQTY